MNGIAAPVAPACLGRQCVSRRLVAASRGADDLIALCDALLSSEARSPARESRRTRLPPTSS